MIEAQPEKRGALARAAAELGTSVDFTFSLLGPESKPEVDFFVMGTGSSVLSELSNVPRETIRLPMRTLDELLGERGMRGPDLLKLDLQGFELEALKGASASLAAAEVVVLECALLPYNEGAPLLPDVFAFMKERSFFPYELDDQHRFEGTLFQVDVFFVKEDSRLRKIAFNHRLP
jgi:FkbM family methyltransferase